MSYRILIVYTILFVSSGRCNYGSSGNLQQSDLPSKPTPVNNQSPPPPPPQPTPPPPQPTPPPPPPPQPNPTPQNPSPPNQQPPPPNHQQSGDNGGSKNISGTWYAVMSSGFTDNGPCNIFTNNESPLCHCISAYIKPLQNDELQYNDYLVYMNAINNETGMLTINMGGISQMNDDKLQSVNIYQGTTRATSFMQSTQFITEKVSMEYNYFSYQFELKGWDVEYKYMITTRMDNNGPQSDTPNTIVWCRISHPGKATIWTQIVQNLKKLNINTHDLKFINQDNCIVPSEKQYDELAYCFDG